MDTGLCVGRCCLHGARSKEGSENCVALQWSPCSQQVAEAARQNTGGLGEVSQGMDVPGKGHLGLKCRAHGQAWEKKYRVRDGVLGG